MTYHGQIAAIIGATRFHLAPHLDERPRDDPERQLMTWLCERVPSAALDVARRSPATGA